jgi:hypothetical protein
VSELQALEVFGKCLGPAHHSGEQRRHGHRL